MAQRPPVRLLVVDLDDTIWHWFNPWHQGFSALLSGISEQSGVSVDELIPEIRSIHQARGTAEYSWLIDELPSLQSAVPDGMTAREFYDPSLHAQNAARLEATALRKGVRETLDHVRTQGTTIVAYTESLEFWTRWRLLKLDLDGIIDEYYSTPDHDAPAGLDPSRLRVLPAGAYNLKHTVHRHVAPGIAKPSPLVLEQIIEDHGVEKSAVAYVGDTLIKDVEMAQRVGALDVWAAYGVNHRKEEYRLLQQVSHWTDEMIRREQDERPEVQPTPRYVLKESFAELLDHFTFESTRSES